MAIFSYSHLESYFQNGKLQDVLQQKMNCLSYMLYFFFEDINMVHVIGERSNLLLHKAEITILSLPSLNVEKYSTVTVLTKKK